MTDADAAVAERTAAALREQGLSAWQDSVRSGGSCCLVCGPGSGQGLVARGAQAGPAVQQVLEAIEDRNDRRPGDTKTAQRRLLGRPRPARRGPASPDAWEPSGSQPLPEPLRNHPRPRQPDAATRANVIGTGKIGNRPRLAASLKGRSATGMTATDRSTQSYGSERVSLSVGVESIGVAL